jgi:cytochrome P450
MVLTIFFESGAILVSRAVDVVGALIPRTTTDDTNPNHWTVLLWIAIVITVGLSFWNLFAAKRTNTEIRHQGGVPIVYRSQQGNAYPFIGHGITLVQSPPWDVIGAWHQGRYSDKSEEPQPIVGFPLMGAMMFSVASPELAKCILQSKISHVQKDVQGTLKPFLSILGTGIVSSDGEHWFQQRLKMSHPLRRDILEIIPIQTLQAVQRLFLIMDAACISGATIPLGSVLRHLTLQVISGSFLSLSAEESDSTFARLYLPIVDESNRRTWHPYRSYLPFLPAFWFYQSNVYRLNQYVSLLVRNRWQLRCQERTSPKPISRPVDVLDKVLQVYETASNTNNKSGSNSHLPLPESIVRQVRDEMKTFMLAGHETSAAAMTWTLYEVLQQPDVLSSIRAEANGVFDPSIDWNQAREADLPPSERLSNLMRTEACLKESLRKYSVVPMVTRRVVEDLNMEMRSATESSSTFFLPKGSTVLVNIQAVHMNPNLWPDPHHYDPYRFLTISPSGVTDYGDATMSSKAINEKSPSSLCYKEHEPYTFLPFIAGPRNCLGQYLALLETKMVIAFLLQRYDISLPSEVSSNTDPRHPYMVPIIPKNEIMVKVSRRSNK